MLNQLMFLFWEQGYDRTSHDDMRDITGLSGSSLYHAFGDKPAIFDAVLERYHVLSEPSSNALTSGTEGAADLLRFVDWVEAHVRGDGTPAGCLMVSTTAARRGRTPAVQSRTRAYHSRLRDALAAALTRATDRGELRAGDAQVRAVLLLSVNWGVMIAAVDEPGSPESLQMLRGLRELIESWACTARPA
ncbi:MAG: TetR/AcrR family transcriptional regulator [Pseudonocardia sp.]|nr:TetR/AcrR family transcriptional regulator [Pseudonocardia sp.]